jgi:hypothetical protein
MPGREQNRPQFAAKSLVRAKAVVTAPDHPDLPIGGWLGTVSQIRRGMCLVHWNQATQEAVRPIHQQRLPQDDRKCLTAMWLPETALEGDPGEPLCIDRRTDRD